MRREPHAASKVAGVDLSGRSTGRTAVVWLDGQPGRPAVANVQSVGFVGPSGDQNLVHALVDSAPQVVAIDAPLSLPHAVVCTDLACPRCFPDGQGASYTRRQLEFREVWTDHGYLSVAPMPIGMLGALAFRAMYLRRMLLRAGIPEVIETWPTGVCRSLERRTGVAPAPKTDAWKRSLLERELRQLELVSGGPAEPDELDAAAAAYAGWCYLTEQAVPIAVAEDEGTIWLPLATG